MKIYFAGSIRGGRGNTPNNMKIIEQLKKYGKVLTEHVGNPNLTTNGEALPEKEIYKRDMAWIAESDIVVADVTTPSLGVGYEIREAEKLEKPVLCLFNKQLGTRLSAMIEGNTHLKILKYDELNKILEGIDNYFNKI